MNGSLMLVSSVC